MLSMNADNFNQLLQPASLINVVQILGIRISDQCFVAYDPLNADSNVWNTFPYL